MTDHITDHLQRKRKRTYVATTRFTAHVTRAEFLRFHTFSVRVTRAEFFKLPSNVRRRALRDMARDAAHNRYLDSLDVEEDP